MAPTVYSPSITPILPSDAEGRLTGRTPGCTRIARPPRHFGVFQNRDEGRGDRDCLAGLTHFLKLIGKRVGRLVDRLIFGWRKSIAAGKIREARSIFPAIISLDDSDEFDGVNHGAPPSL